MGKESPPADVCDEGGDRQADDRWLFPSASVARAPDTPTLSLGRDILGTRNTRDFKW